MLHPPQQLVPGSDNANSVTLWIRCQAGSLLLPGDLEPPGLDMLLSQPRRVSTILLAPHHGSPRSDPGPMAEWCQPSWVVICGDRRHPTSEVTRAYIDRGAEVLETSRLGAVRILFRNQTAQAFTWSAAAGWQRRRLPRQGHDERQGPAQLSAVAAPTRGTSE